MKILTILFLLLLANCAPSHGFQEPSPPVSEQETTQPPSPLRIIALDVGQGNATVIITPQGQTLLIDAGPPGNGLEIIIPFLEDEEIQDIHSIFVSHYDADHIGGLLDLIPGKDKTLDTDDDWIPLKGIWDRGDKETDNKSYFPPYNTLTSPWRQTTLPGDQWTIDGVTLTAVVVNGIYEDGVATFLSEDDENGRSLGLLVEYKDFRYLTTGDLTGGGASGTKETLNLEGHLGEIVGDIDVLHISHHGSLTSTNEQFLDFAQPEMALISVGEVNDFGHPHPIVLKRLLNRGISIYQTALEGSIEVQTDGRNYWLTPF